MSIGSSAKVGIMAKGQRVMGSMANFLTQHRAATVALSILLSVFLQTWNPEQQVNSNETGITIENEAGLQLVTSDSMDSLNRASVLARAKSVPSSASGKAKPKVTL